MVIEKIGFLKPDNKKDAFQYKATIKERNIRRMKHANIMAIEILTYAALMSLEKFFVG